MHKPLIALAVTAGILLTACGGNSGNESAESTVETELASVAPENLEELCDVIQDTARLDSDPVEVMTLLMGDTDGTFTLSGDDKLHVPDGMADRQFARLTVDYCRANF